MTKREAVLRALSHQDVRPVPYYLDLSDETARAMRAYTSDPRFFEHSGSYLAQERNESFVDLADGLFQDQFGVVWDKGKQEGDFGVVHEIIQKSPAWTGIDSPIRMSR